MQVHEDIQAKFAKELVRLFKWSKSDRQARKFQEFIQAFGKSLMDSESLLSNKKTRVTIYNYRPPVDGEKDKVAELAEVDSCDEHSLTGEADGSPKETKSQFQRSGYEHYSTSSVLQRWAKSKSIRSCNVKLAQRLKRRLEKVAHICDLSVVYLNQEVAQLQEGVHFGDLALKNEGETRKASIKMLTDCYLAYLDRRDYNKVMKTMMLRGSQKKMQVLKQSRLFQKVSQVKLQRIELDIKPIKLGLKQIVYREGDDVDGIYIVRKGSIKYQKDL